MFPLGKSTSEEGPGQVTKKTPFCNSEAAQAPHSEAHGTFQLAESADPGIKAQTQLELMGRCAEVKACITTWACARRTHRHCVLMGGFTSELTATFYRLKTMKTRMVMSIEPKQQK